MLALFIVRRVFNKLKVSLVVDLEHKDAEINISYDGRLKTSQTLRFDEVSSPEKAEAYLSRHAGVQGSFIETLEFAFRMQGAA